MEINKETLAMVVPKEMKNKVDIEVIQRIGELCDDPDLADTLKENIISYTSVLNEGKFKMKDYLTAVKYCTYKLLGDTNTLAYSKTFPDKMLRWNAEGKQQKEIARYTTGFNQSKLVKLIMAQGRMPTHILNADVFQAAINRQAYLMMNAKSEKIQSDAANSLLTHLKSPEAQKIELGVSLKGSSKIQELEALTMKLAAQQADLVKSGAYNAKEIAHQSIVLEGEFTSDEV